VYVPCVREPANLHFFAAQTEAAMQSVQRGGQLSPSALEAPAGGRRGFISQQPLLQLLAAPAADAVGETPDEAWGQLAAQVRQSGFVSVHRGSLSMP
jgi:hypothetical protein